MGSGNAGIFLGELRRGNSYSGRTLLTKLGIVARQFPVVSETFILDHVSGLAERGRDIGVFCRNVAHGMAPLPQEVAQLQAAGRVHEWLPERGHFFQRVVTGTAAAATLPPGALLRAAALGINALPRDVLIMARTIRHVLHPRGILHAHFGPCGEQLALMKKAGLISGPLIASLHGYDATQDAAQRRAQYRHLFEAADRIVVTTNFMADKALALGCPADKILRNPIGIRLDRFTLEPRQWSPGKPLRLLSTARLVEKKGIEYGIRAAALLVAANVNVEYRIIGSGPLENDLRSLAARLGIARQVAFLGAQSREVVMQTLASSHLFVFPSVTASDGDQEGQGMALIEAQACGLPCVATRSGGIPEVLQDGVNGYLVPERDGQALCDAVLRLLTHSDRWAEMAHAGRQWVERQFSLSGHLDTLEKLYANATAGRHD